MGDNVVVKFMQFRPVMLGKWAFLDQLFFFKWSLFLGYFNENRSELVTIYGWAAEADGG